MYEHAIRLVGPIDSIHVEMVDGRAGRDSIASADFERRLAAARARPRHWSCKVPAAEVHSRALDAYAEFFGESSGGMRDAGLSYGMPPGRSAFLRDFRAITDQRECRHLAQALDRQQGLVDDDLYVFRTGKVYFMPGLEGGTIIALSGKIIAVYVAQ